MFLQLLQAKNLKVISTLSMEWFVLNIFIYLIYQVKFIETFEAWARRRIGCIVIEFTTFDGSDAFMRAAIERRIPYLGDVGVQHVGIV